MAPRRAKCRNCGKAGHYLRDCAEPVRGGKLCQCCDEIGHRARDCPSKPAVENMLFSIRAWENLALAVALGSKDYKSDPEASRHIHRVIGSQGDASKLRPDRFHLTYTWAWDYPEFCELAANIWGLSRGAALKALSTDKGHCRGKYHNLSKDCDPQVHVVEEIKDSANPPKHSASPRPLEASSNADWNVVVNEESSLGIDTPDSSASSIVSAQLPTTDGIDGSKQPHHTIDEPRSASNGDGLNPIARPFEGMIDAPLSWPDKLPSFLPPQRDNLQSCQTPSPGANGRFVNTWLDDLPNRKSKHPEVGRPIAPGDCSQPTAFASFPHRIAVIDLNTDLYEAEPPKEEGSKRGETALERIRREARAIGESISNGNKPPFTGTNANYNLESPSSVSTWNLAIQYPNGTPSGHTTNLKVRLLEDIDKLKEKFEAAICGKEEPERYNAQDAAAEPAHEKPSESPAAAPETAAEAETKASADTPSFNVVAASCTQHGPYY